ncbi:ATP-binding protein [Variovorax sp. JS1663]|uniref:ATP-binding protein n=1 Tax=Variovorax sp. JS1663 TaxID=1851577 RepID=UPI000B343786|nr:ATP-binding protein [Variovorax sp. JS1663]OUM02567.1 two-component sensor histidine kinase [Variovorax sp. JS1663]
MPRLTLTRKIFFALATLLVLLLLISAGFSIFALQRGLGPYVAEIEIRRMDWLAQLLQKHYVANGGWDRLRDNEELWRRLQMGDAGLPRSEGREGEDARLPPWYARSPRLESGEPPGPPPQLELLPRRYLHPAPPWLFAGLRDAADSIYRRLGVVDAQGRQVAGATVDPASAAHLPIRRANLVVGELVLAPVEGIESEADRAFVARQSGFIALTGLVGLGLALVLSWLLARRWLSPIDALTQGAQDVARGRLGTRVQVQGSDELALLGRTFNDMAERLDTADASRRAWLADVAHELRTPLAAMRAEIEALQDGVRSFDDRTALRLHRQVMRLGQLVDDLRSSMREPQAEALTRAPVFPLALLKEALAATRDRFAQRRIAVDAETVDVLAAPSQPMVEGDAHRLHQVFMNLLDNTLAYTDAGGLLRIGAAVEGSAGAQRLVLRFDDSAPGVAPHELPMVFERLFRADSSRSREFGGSGLGLSICRAMVEAHGGEIDASASPLGGLRIVLWLPLAPAS